ncbi:MAG: alcohol dehydrogenase catalytic domain-containing protein [Acidobacteria bacterium]|nr:alcohol dehydrogenase catalytic domain-containing protein [Acidobacteriota bacterium]MCW5968604.1 alcohol dehydrogenase catalytic domain-containing protein [Blastocatellales bacterium]
MSRQTATSVMRALALVAPGRMEVREIARPAPQSREVLLRVGGVGLCGTDFHIFEGHANYHSDAQGRLIPLSEQAQILGHEFCGTVVETGSAVTDLRVGDRVVVDQGLSCVSRAAEELCEYCATGNSHQCIEYREHGITGLQGALAEYIAAPAVNAVKVESDLPMEQCALVEPLGCIIHSSAMLQQARARYTFNGERPVRNVLVCGAGPAGLLFTQYLRNVLGFEGLLIVSEPSGQRRELALGYGASAALDPAQTELAPAVQDLTRGERIHCLIESAGAAQLFRQMPGLLRKQATVLLYGHGHHGVDLGVLNNVQFLEPTLVSPIGASGGFDQDGRPGTYRQALDLLSSGRINVSRFITHCYRTLEEVPRGFAEDRRSADFIKGVALLDH